MNVEADEQLYLWARQGDVEAFDRLYARYERRLFGFLTRVLPDREQARDVFHDTFLSLLEGPALRFDQARFSAWLFRVARNGCANRYRSDARGARALSRLDAPQLPSTPEERVVEAERAFALAAAVRRLPGGLADVFQLRSSGLSYEEIASVLEVPLGTVKSRMNALVLKLREELP